VRREILVLRAPPARRAREASRVSRGRKEKEASPVLRDHKGPQDRRETPQIQTGCNSLRIAFPSWKRDFRRPPKKAVEVRPQPRTRSTTLPVFESTNPSSLRRKKGMAAVVRTASVRAASEKRNPSALAFAWMSFNDSATSSIL
jgi:hypothetical protein